MHIVGHGIDIVEISRIARLLSKSDDLVLGWFAEDEQAELSVRGVDAAGVGGRVAAKEACAKALGTGFSGDVSWQDVRVRSGGTGAPTIQLYDGALAVARSLGVARLFLSISHSSTTAIASVIAEGEGQTIPR